MLNVNLSIFKRKKRKQLQREMAKHEQLDQEDHSEEVLEESNSTDDNNVESPIKGLRTQKSPQIIPKIEESSSSTDDHQSELRKSLKGSR